ncbi:MAG: T9SS type A sorting domain-containing protein [Flavobacteriales bacterium]|nr:T9SS type A sorting domain-containing protein [Flavobacteriales bacterium]
MKKIFTLFTVLLGVSGLYAQSNVNNPGFEDWSEEIALDSLNYWFSSNTQLYFIGEDPNVVQDDDDPQDGDFSVSMETIFVYDDFSMENDTIFGFCAQGTPGDDGFIGIPYTDTVDQFTFWYKCDVEAGDSAIAMIQLSKDGLPYALAFYKMGGTVTDWTEAVVDIPNGETEAPDSLWIAFASSDPLTPGAPQEGSMLSIDNVTLQNTGGTTVPTPLSNNSFEDLYELTVDNPDDWFTFNNLSMIAFGESYAAESSEASEGSSSIQITTTEANADEGIPAIATNGEFNFETEWFSGGQEFLAQPSQMLVDYQYQPAPDDTASVWVQFWNNTSGMLIDTAIIFTTEETDWETATIDLDFDEAPDSILVILFSGNELGSELLIDNIRFTGGDVGLQTIHLSDSWNVFPNPSNESATVIFEEANQISVVNLNGQVVYQNLKPTQNKLELNTSNWSEGVYFIKLQSESKTETKKLVVTH